MADGNVATGPSLDEDVLNEAAKWRKGGRNVALATVVSTWGSSPRPIGSHLAVDEYGVTNELAWEVGLACGGTIQVFVEKVE